MRYLKTLGYLFICIIVFSCSDDEVMIMDPEPEPDPGLICGVDNFTVDLFDSLRITTVQFGRSINVDGIAMDLFMDVYQPEGDTSTSRPVIVWAFGGAFIGGQRTDMDFFAQTFARRGYVCATFDYRLYPFLTAGLPDSTDIADIAIKATHDMKAAVRHLRQDAATDNLFKIDPDRIIAGGVSAGAITALQTGVLKDGDVTLDYLLDIIDANGGLEGASGDAENLSYSSDVSLVINLSGAVFDLDWIDPEDVPIISYHGDADEVVPFGIGNANVFGIDLTRLFGSGAIHPHCDDIGLRNSLFTVPGGDHVGIYTEEQFVPQRDQFLEDLSDFLLPLVCN